MKNAVSARLSERTAPEIANTIYTPGMASFDDDAFEAMCRLNEAHLVMLAKTGLLEKSTAKVLAASILKIRKAGRESVVLDPQFEDSYFAFENRLSTVAGAEATGWIHTGRSRNDIGATLDRMHARRLCLSLIEKLATARVACLSLAAKHSDTIMPGYTHLQPAQPITFGYYMTNVAGALERENERFEECFKRINRSSLGAAAMAGTTFAIDRTLTAELLGFDGIVVPCLDAVGSRDFVTELLWAATSTLSMLSRVAQDLYVFCTNEFSALSFPDRVAGTSSIMPQKKNMLALEYFRAAAGRSIGALTGSLASIKGSNYSIGLDSVREGIAEAWPSLHLFEDGLDLLRVVFETAEPNEKLLRERCESNFTTATDLADGLVKRFKMPFRDAHHVVGGAVQIALNEGRVASEMTAEIVNRAAKAELGHELEIDDAFISRCMNPQLSIEARTTPGGTAPTEVRRMIASMTERLNTDLSFAHKRRESLAAASTKLAGEITNLASI